ncbi:MAG: shikimate dehydrogenase [Bacteroidales bacterium]|nr:shikimate dehydrogenase [Bacteroidales bacterium]
MTKLYGIIGKSLTHSFSKKYFKHKFKKENRKDVSYEIFPLDSIHQFPLLMQQHPLIEGLNVTIPYKEDILKYVDILDATAEKVGAVNVLKILRKDTKYTVYAYNTDIIGFDSLLKKYTLPSDTQALILGNGGAAKAVAFVLKSMQIPYQSVSRQEQTNTLLYQQITDKIIQEHHLIINCTPLGMLPHVDSFPHIPYKAIGDKHLLIDLVYNPSETLFLKKGKEQRAGIENGYDMFYLQAEASWKIWNTSPQQ